MCDGGETHFMAWVHSGGISSKKQTYTELWALFSHMSLTDCWRANLGGTYQPKEYAYWLEIELTECKY
jgi:hypothetical protein